MTPTANFTKVDSTATEVHPTIRFLKALGKADAFIRSWLGKGTPDIPNLYKGEPGRCYNVRCDRSGEGLDAMRWDENDWARLVKELERQNKPATKKTKSFPFQAGGFCPYVVVNNGGHKQSDIESCGALFAEFDLPMTKEESLLKLLSFPIPYSILIESRNGYHAYWLLDKATTPKLWRQMQHRLIEFFESDAGIEDPSRCMRLPGFYHLAEGQEPFMVNLWECHEDRHYSLEDFDQVLPDVPEWRLKLERHSKPYTPIKSEDGTEWDIRNFKHVLTHYRESARREWDTCQCPVHGEEGHSKDSLHINSRTGAYRCWNGCDSKDIYQRVCEKSGWMRPKSEHRQQIDPLDRPANLSRPQTLLETSTSPTAKRNGYHDLRLAITEALLTGDTLEREFELGTIATKFGRPRPFVDRVVRDLTKRHEQRKTSFSLKDLQELDSQGVQWAIPRFLPKKGLTLLGGFAKDGKSTLTYEMVASLVTGRDFLGEKPRKLSRVLFIQLEESEEKIREKLDGVGVLYDPNVLLSDSIRIEREWTIDDLETLERWIIDHRAEVVFIDSLRAASRDTGVDENAAAFANPVYALQAFFNKMGVTGYVIHHFSKNKDAVSAEKFAGSSAIPGAADNLHLLVRESTDSDSTRRQLALSGRDCKGRFQIEYSEEEFPKFKFELRQEIGCSAEDKTLKERIMNVIRMNQDSRPQGLTKSEIAEGLALSHNDRSLYRPLKQLTVFDRALTVTRAEHDKRVQLYSIPSTPEDSSPPSTVSTSSLSSNSTSNPPPPLDIPSCVVSPETLDMQELDRVLGCSQGGENNTQQGDVCSNFESNQDSVISLDISDTGEVNVQDESQRSENYYTHPVETHDLEEGVTNTERTSNVVPIRVSPDCYTRNGFTGGGESKPFVVDVGGYAYYTQNAKPNGKRLPAQEIASAIYQVATSSSEIRYEFHKGDIVLWNGQTRQIERIEQRADETIRIHLGLNQWVEARQITPVSQAPEVEDDLDF
jgi:hypothetical protein